MSTWLNRLSMRADEVGNMVAGLRKAVRRNTTFFDRSNEHGSERREFQQRLRQY